MPCRPNAQLSEPAYQPSGITTSTIVNLPSTTAWNTSPATLLSTVMTWPSTSGSAPSRSAGTSRSAVTISQGSLSHWRWMSMRAALEMPRMGAPSVASAASNRRRLAARSCAPSAR